LVRDRHLLLRLSVVGRVGRVGSDIRRH
jgi:hypothetical protein